MFRSNSSKKKQFPDPQILYAALLTSCKVSLFTFHVIISYSLLYRKHDAYNSVIYYGIFFSYVKCFRVTKNGRFITSEVLLPLFIWNILLLHMKHDFRNELFWQLFGCSDSTYTGRMCRQGEEW